MPITPFHFRLKKVSEREQRLLEAVQSFLPATGLREGFRRGIQDAIARHLGDELVFRLEAIQYEPIGAFLSKLANPAMLAIFSIPPSTHKAILELDVPLAMMAVERLLGGQSESMPQPRTLSDTEQGVLQYLLLQILSHIHRLCGEDARVHARFDRFAFGVHEIRDVTEAHAGIAVLIFRVVLGRHSGFVRLALPDPFIEEALLADEAADEVRPAERQERQRAMARFGYVRVPVWAEAGRTTLPPGELKHIEEGDVILFDESEATIENGHPAGRMVLRVGSGLAGGLDCDVTVGEGHARASIVGIHKGA